MSYDSKPDTVAHILRVNDLLHMCAEKLIERGVEHDASKLKEPEKGMFDRYIHKLKGLTYGSDDYEKNLGDLSEAMRHHYANNSHHPEHYENGVSGMDLFDLVEMFMDWKAATERHTDGDIYHSIRVNTIRFGLNPQVVDILMNTASRLGWKPKE